MWTGFLRKSLFKTADHPYNPDCKCMQCQSDRENGQVSVAGNQTPNKKADTGGGDMSVSQLDQNGGKLQPQDGPVFKKKRPKIEGV